MNYLIPKNIKVKKEIFKGYGIKEITFVSFSLLLGYMISIIPDNQTIKLVLFAIPSLLSILLTIPLPSGLTVFKILKKYIFFINCQKKYKKGGINY